VEFTPSLKLGGGFEFGPSVMVLLGTDSSFSEHNEAQNNPVLAGLKLSLKLDNNDYFFRFSGQGMTSVQLENRSALMGAVSVELGIPIVGGKTRIREREVHTVRDRYQREIVETEQTFVKLEQKDVIREMVMFSFDDQVVHFEFDKAQLTPESQAFVRKLGEYLASREDLWGRVRIEGHTDNRGSDEYNQRLSNARAGEIRRILAEAGVRQDRVESRGYGKAQPLDHGEDDVARARNRRVELSFSDVKSPKELRDQINRIKFASIKPSTCTDGSCR
jgi:outer membrane protein OmpA-like peptidoglycan-associated protein